MQKEDTVKSQVIWKGGNKTKNWYSYVCRTPQVQGHIILAYEGKYTEKAPPGFQEALNVNIGFLIRWARQYKLEKCHPVFFRMNIEQEQFRVHILPVSQKEIVESTKSLHRRVPQLKGKGGFIYYLARREEEADRLQVRFNELSDDRESIKKLMKELQITQIVEQLRNIVNQRNN